MIKRLLILGLLAGLAVGTWLAPSGPARGVLAVALLFATVGVAIAWLSGQGTRLSRSGRDPREHFYLHQGPTKPTPSACQEECPFWRRPAHSREGAASGLHSRIAGNLNATERTNGPR